MKPSTGIGLLGLGLVAAGAALAAYTFLIDDDVKGQTKESLDDLINAATDMAQKLKVNAEEAAQKAQKVAEENIQWTQQQWDKIASK